MPRKGVVATAAATTTTRLETIILGASEQQRKLSHPTNTRPILETIIKIIAIATTTITIIVTNKKNMPMSWNHYEMSSMNGQKNTVEIIKVNKRKRNDFMYGKTITLGTFIVLFIS
jgi:hypothetical protein